MDTLEFYELYNNLIPKVVKKKFEEIPMKDKEKYDVFLSSISSGVGAKSIIKRNYESNVSKVKKQGFFNDNILYSNCIRVSSLCDALIRNKVVCFTIRDGIPTELLMINYSIAIEVVKQSLLYMINKESDKGNMVTKLLYPTEGFEEILLLSLIVNDNTHQYKFDILNFALILLLLCEYNKEKLKNK